MIAYVEGRLAERTDHFVVVVTDGGVGYEVHLPDHSMGRLPERGGRVAYYASLIVREDAQELFGFETWDERRMFEVLITLTKVGARTAAAILSRFRPDDLRRIVLEDDPTPLTAVSGIGRKTAQQIFLELQYKLKADGVAAPSPSPAGGTRIGDVLGDALAGLEGLGYAEAEAMPVLRQVLKEHPGADVSEVLRAALKLLASAARGDAR